MEDNIVFNINQNRCAESDVAKKTRKSSEFVNESLNWSCITAHTHYYSRPFPSLSAGRAWKENWKKKVNSPNVSEIEVLSQ